MSNCCYGEDVTALATLISRVIAQGRTSEQIALLSAVFTIIGSDLALMSIIKGANEKCCEELEKGKDLPKIKNYPY